MPVNAKEDAERIEIHVSEADTKDLKLLFAVSKDGTVSDNNLRETLEG